MDKDDDEARVSLAKDGFAAGGAPGFHAAHPPGAPDGAEPVEAFVSAAAYTTLGVLGAVFGVVGSFVQAWTVGRIPLAAIVLVVLVFLMSRLSGHGMGGRLGALLPTATWTLMAFLLSIRRAEGDLIVAGTLSGGIYLFGGMIAAVLGMMLTPPARPPGEWLLGRAGRMRG